MMLEERLREIIHHAYNSAPGIRRNFMDSGITPDDIRGIDDLSKLRVTRKSSLAERQKQDPPFGGFNGVPVPSLQRIFMSPGPIYDPQGSGEDYWRWAEALEEAGFGPGDIVQNSFSYHFTPAGFMFDSGLRALGCVVVPSGVGNNELQVRIMHDLGVTGYVGVPSFLMALIKKAEEMGYIFRRDFHLCKAFVTAEPLPHTMRKELLGDYGVEVYQGYGTADVGCIAYECRLKEGMHLGKAVLVEIVDPETDRALPPGEVGEVVVTLLEETYPLLRFATGDLAAITGEPCPCGRASPRITGIFGRADDACKVRGIFVHPRQLHEALGKVDSVARYQAVVSRERHVDQITVNVELKEGYQETEPLKDRLEGVLRSALRLKAAVQFVSPGSIPPDSRPLLDTRRWE